MAWLPYRLLAGAGAVARGRWAAHAAQRPGPGVGDAPGGRAGRGVFALLLAATIVLLRPGIPEGAHAAGAEGFTDSTRRDAV
ncbi:hypothetical protein GCM10017776_20140 [Streptomyces griseoluteus]|nr:hypothetical protein GCM10017776_20140 [Streptomyces griseoluteus]